MDNSTPVITVSNSSNSELATELITRALEMMSREMINDECGAYSDEEVRVALALLGRELAEV